MVLLAKGSFLVIIGLTIACIISNTYAQQDSHTTAPAVLSASRVPVEGGLLHIYGRNFGTDASRIKVRILEKELVTQNQLSSSISSSQGDIVECTNVEIVASDTAISCHVAYVGTGKSKHIAVSITNSNGLISSNDDDNNVAFNREVPSLQTLTYNVEEKKIVIAGINFGYNASNVLVALDGIIYPVLDTENAAITLRLLKKRRVDQIDYQPPTSKLVHVEVDGQANVANMSVALAPSEEAVVAESKGAGMDRNTVAGIVVGGVMGITLISLIAALYVRNKYKRGHGKQDTAPSSDNKGKPETRKVSSGLEAVQIGVTREKSSPAIEAEPTFVPAPATQANVLSASSPGEEDVVILTPASDTMTNRSNVSLEEIDLHEDHNNNINLYEKNIEVLSDSSFSESSSDDISEGEDEEGEGPHSSSFSDGDFSDASPAHSPVASPNKERRQQLQMSSEYPPGMFMPPQKSLRIMEANSPSPSPPTLTHSRLGLSSLRHVVVIPPPLDLDEKADGNYSSDGSPLPSPALSKGSNSSSAKTSPSRKYGGKKSAKRGGGGGGLGRGMIRVPSSRLASSASMSSVVHNPFDSPHL